MSNDELPGLYVHVPFCRKKCPYCDFYSVPTLSLVPEWLAAVEKEAVLYKEKFSQFDSLYLGGGTPTLLGDRDLATLMECLRRHFAFSRGTEITIEANPEDVTPAKLNLIGGLGINRISVGVQSFDERALRFLKRRHTAGQSARALKFIRSAGFTNLGVDLIYGIEGQSETEWVGTLERALEFKPEHLSCYLLTIEEGTPFGKLRTGGKIRSTGEEQERALFLTTSQFLEDRGYIHYEISNFAAGRGNCSRHNQKYWCHAPYLGLGPAAHSFLDGVRWWNVRSIERYCEALGTGGAPVEGKELLTKEQLRLETILLGMRTREGVDLGILQEKQGSDVVLAKLKKAGLLKTLDGRAIPTREGQLVADSLPLLFLD